MKAILRKWFQQQKPPPVVLVRIGVLFVCLGILGIIGNGTYVLDFALAASAFAWAALRKRQIETVNDDNRSGEA